MFGAESGSSSPSNLPQINLEALALFTSSFLSIALSVDSIAKKTNTQISVYLESDSKSVCCSHSMFPRFSWIFSSSKPKRSRDNLPWMLTTLHLLGTESLRLLLTGFLVSTTWGPLFRRLQWRRIPGLQRLGISLGIICHRDSSEGSARETRQIVGELSVVVLEGKRARLRSTALPEP